MNAYIVFRQYIADLKNNLYVVSPKYSILDHKYRRRILLQQFIPIKFQYVAFLFFIVECNNKILHFLSGNLIRRVLKIGFTCIVTQFRVF